jgi:hypothetical protein
VNPHDIIRQTDGGVECRCGWEGTREAHRIHFGAEEAREGLAAARAALQGQGEQ